MPTNLDYITTRKPSNESVQYGLNFEELGFSFADVGEREKRVCVTGGHNRPLILEQEGTAVVPHWMGLKPPLVPPSVTVAGSGSLTAAIQVAFQRINSKTGQRSEISPLWPGTGVDSVSPADKSWSAMSQEPTVWIGANETTITGIRQEVEFSDDSETSIAFSGTGQGLVSSKFIMSGISLFGNVPNSEIQELGEDAAGVDLKVALFKGTTRITDWVEIAKKSLPREGDSPQIKVTFSAPVEIEDTATYRVYIVVNEATPASYVNLFFKRTDTSQSPDMERTTDATPETGTYSTVATFVNSLSIPSSGVPMLGGKIAEARDRLPLPGVNGAATRPGVNGYQACYDAVLAAMTGPSYFCSSIVRSSKTGNRLFAVMCPGKTVDGDDNLTTSANALLLVGSGKGTTYYDAAFSTTILTNWPTLGVLTRAKMVEDPSDDDYIYMFHESFDGATRELACTRITFTGTTVTAAPFAVTDLDDAALGATSDDYDANYIADVKPISGGGAYVLVAGESGVGRIIKLNSSFAITAQHASAECEDALQIAVDPNDSTILYMATAYSFAPGVYKSTDSGENWTIVKSGNFYCVATAPGVSPTRLYAGGDQKVSYSANAGSTWTDVTVGASGQKARSVIVGSTASVVHTALSDSGLIYRSADSGVTYTKMDGSERATSSDPDGLIPDGNNSISKPNGASPFPYVESPLPGLYYGYPRWHAPASAATAFNYASMYNEAFGVTNYKFSDNDLVYRLVTNSSLTISTATAHASEPESVGQGGTEDYDKFSILIRDRTDGVFREVGVVDAGDSLIYNESADSLRVKNPIVPGFWETPGGFDCVQPYRAQGQERLVFAGQPGYDSFVGIPGAKDYEDEVVSPFVYRRAGEMYLTGGYVGLVSSVSTKTATLTRVNAANFANLSVGDVIPFVRYNGGGFLIVTAKSSAGGVYTITHSGLAVSESLAGSEIHLGYGSATAIGTASVAPATFGSNGLYYITLSAGYDSQLLASVSPGDYLPFSGATYKGFLLVSSVRAGSGIITFSLPDSVANNIESGATVYFKFGSIYNSITAKGIRFLNEAGTEISRAYLDVDSTSKIVTLKSSHARTSLGLIGAFPGGAAKAQTRTILVASVQRGATRVRLSLPVADDYWHQRDVSFEGDSYQGRIRKIVKFDPADGSALPIPEIELAEPWAGDDHNNTPIQIVSDFSSLHIAGAELGQTETISDFTKLNLLPATAIGALAVASGRLMAFTEANEIYEVQISNFLIPTDVQTAIGFAIEDFIAQKKETAVFTRSSKATAVDAQGRVYIAGPAGLYAYSSPNVEYLLGQRSFFQELHPTVAKRIALAFDPGIYPEQMLRVAGLGFAEGEATEQLAFVPGRGQWLGLGGGPSASALASGVGQDGSGYVFFGGNGKVGVYGQAVTASSPRAWPGDDFGRNAAAHGLGRGGPAGFFVTGAEISGLAGETYIYEIDATYVDAETQSELLDLSGYSTILNCPVEGDLGAKTPVLAARTGIKVGKWNTATGEYEEGEVLGIKEVASSSNTLFVYSETAWTVSASARYYVVIGPREWQITLPSIEPQGRATALQLKRLEVDVDPGGTATSPWWMKVEVFAAKRTGETDWANPVLTRVVPWTRLLESRGLMYFRTGLYRSLAVRLSGHAPIDSNITIGSVRVVVEDVMR